MYTATFHESRQNYVKNLNVNKRRQDIDKKFWESKKYWVKGLTKEFPNKKWSRPKRGVEDFQKRL